MTTWSIQLAGTADSCPTAGSTHTTVRHGGAGVGLGGQPGGYALLEKFWRISLHVTDDAIAELCR